MVAPKLFTIRGHSRSKALGMGAFVPGSMNNFGATIRTKFLGRTLLEDKFVAVLNVAGPGDFIYVPILMEKRLRI